MGVEQGPLTKEQVMEIIPHRPPILLLKSIKDVKFGESAVGVMEDWTKDPVLGIRKTFPPSLIIEALSQVGAVALLGLPENEGKIAMLAGVDGFSFGDPIKRGDVVTLEARLGRMRPNFGKRFCSRFSKG